MKVNFRELVDEKTLLVGEVKIQGKDCIKYLIRKTESKDMVAVWVSTDRGYSARLLPRISADTAHECYHLSIQEAKNWIVKFEEWE